MCEKIVHSFIFLVRKEKDIHFYYVAAVLNDSFDILHDFLDVEAFWRDSVSSLLIFCV